MSVRTESQGRFRPKDYLVGFFGSLVPGIMFIVLAIPATAVPAAIVIRSRMDLGSAPLPGASLLTQTGPVVLLSLIVLVFAYVIGYLFFRQDTKPVDRCSCLLYGEDDGPVVLGIEGLIQARRRFREHEVYPLKLLAGWWLRVRTWLNRSWREELKEKVQYPYPDLDQYLHDRGFTRLRRLVDKYGTHRSKHLINRLKIVINSLRPEMYHSIAQAEAHVRLSSSSWYVCNALTLLGGVGLLIGLLGGGQRAGLEDMGMLLSILLPSTVIFTAMWIKRQIVKAFHYQRIREIIIVLQTFVTALAIERRLDGVADVRLADLAGPEDDHGSPRRRRRR